MKILAIVGARPQFIKHFPFEKACKNEIELKTIHTGQHYDVNMSEVFFDQLGMKKPDFMLHIGSGNHGVQTAKMMIEIEKIVEKEKPNGMVVYGDTNSTLAGALVASKLHIPVFHIEAGLRSFNKEMPEEINRVLTDHVSQNLFVPSEIAIENLRKEGIHEGVYNVGDIMKDIVCYIKNINLISDRSIKEKYYYTTIHRPYNTDSKERLKYILESLNTLDVKVLMSIHPRTKNLMNTYDLKEEDFKNVLFISPQSYFDNLSCLYHSEGLITDSGGMQKEAYWLVKKCVTIRKETEWVETLLNDKNVLVFNDLSNLNALLKKAGKNNWNESLYGDGNTANKIVDIIKKTISPIAKG